MNGYFRPLRRKLGVITLVAACVLMGVLIRSLDTLDEIEFVAIGSFNTIVAKSGTVAWCSEPYDPDYAQAYIWGTRPIPNSDKLYPITSYIGRVDKHLWRQYWQTGFGLSFSQPAHKTGQTAIVVIIPLWSIVIAVTLLSAGLLLSKPRVGKTVE